MLRLDRAQSEEFDDDGFRDPMEPLPEHDHTSSIVEDEIDRYLSLEKLYDELEELIDHS